MGTSPCGSATHSDHQVPWLWPVHPSASVSFHCLPPQAAFRLQSSSAERDLGALAGTKLVMVRHGVEVHRYPKLHEEN